MDLEAYVKASSPADPAMHLTHCASAFNAIKMLQSQKLLASLCPVYGVDLLYMFYGRPAYKTSAGLPPSNILDLAPVCLVLDPKVLREAVRIMPFDSGGFKHYQQTIGPQFQLSDFELGKQQSIPRKLVGAFFDNNRHYYDQKYLPKNDSIPFGKLTARAYARLINDPTFRSTDDRASTVEIQFAEDVPLKSVLRALVAPAAFLEDPDVQKALKPLGKVLPLPYKTYGRNEPSAFSWALYDHVDRYLTNEGVMS